MTWTRSLPWSGKPYASSLNRLTGREILTDLVCSKAQISLQDDPGFIPDLQLPEMDTFMLSLMDGTGSSRFKNGNDFSQLTPRTRRSPQASAGHSKINLELESASLFGNLGWKSPAGLYGSSVKRAENTLRTLEPLPSNIAFPEETNMRILEDGTIEFLDGQDQPTVTDGPPPPRLAQAESAPMGPEDEHVGGPSPQRRVSQDDQLMMGGDDLEHPPSQHPDVQPSKPAVQEQPVPPQNLALVRQKSPRRRFTPDEATRVPMHTLKSWAREYCQNQETARVKAALCASVRQSKQNAYQFVFGLGTNLIGRDTPPGGASGCHELARHFAGDKLASAILGTAKPSEGEFGEHRGVKRKSRGREGREGREEHEEHEEEGKVQARPREWPQAGGVPAQADDQEMRMTGDDLVEIGREPRPELSDHPSMPWNRSFQPGTATKTRSAHGFLGAPSYPPAGPFGKTQDLEHEFTTNHPSHILADPSLVPLCEKDFSQDASHNHPSKAIPTHTTHTTHNMAAAADREWIDFLDRLEDIARVKGVHREDDDEELFWINFDDVVQPGVSTKADAVSAFLNVLTLKSKGLIEVEQEGQETMTPFGPIRIGVYIHDYDSDMPSKEEEARHEHELDMLTERLDAQSQPGPAFGRERHESGPAGEEAAHPGSDHMDIDEPEVNGSSGESHLNNNSQTD